MDIIGFVKIWLAFQAAEGLRGDGPRRVMRFDATGWRVAAAAYFFQDLGAQAIFWKPA